MEGSQLTISIMDSKPNHEETVCAIEVCNIAESVSEQMLGLFFENERKSGNSQYQDLMFDTEQRRAVITFDNPAGTVVYFVVLHML